jgi:hypothetical protein
VQDGGILNLGGSTLTASNSFTVQSGGTLELQGGETISNLPTLESDSTVTYDGSGTYASLVAGTSYRNLSFTGSGSWATSSDLTITGDFTQTDGTFTHTGTTTFTGTNIIITTASTSFGNVDAGATFVDITSGLEAHWKFDEGSDTSAADDTGNGYTGTLTNMEDADWSTSDKPNLAFTNDASLGTNANDEYVSVNVAVGTSWTISAWFKWPLESTASWNTLIRGTSNHHIIVRRSDNLLGAYVAGFKSSGYDMDVLSSGWHHIAAVGSGSVTEFYIDGSSVGSSATKPTDNVTTIGNYAGGSQQWGRFDDVRIYTTALSPDDVASIVSPGISTSSITLAGNFTLAGNLTLGASSTLDVSTTGCSGSPCDITLAGNWTNNGGTFTPRTGTVTLNGSGQYITGTTTFNNLLKSTDSTDTLYFGAGQTQTVTGTWTVNGAASNLLSLRSTTEDTDWFIDPQNTRTLSYLNVKDSNNTNSTAIIAYGLNITDGTNNTNWTFEAPPAIQRATQFFRNVQLLPGVHLY